MASGRLGLFHTRLVRSETRSNPHCAVCKDKRTAWYCLDCGKHMPICQNFSSTYCHLEHMLEHLSVEEWGAAKNQYVAVEDFGIGSQPGS